MELRDKLLSSEIRHMTDMVNILSYELVIIQDFMNHQFGGKFKKFREQHHLICEVMPQDNCAGVPSSRKLSKTASNVGSRSHPRGRKDTQESDRNVESVSNSIVDGDEASAEPLVESQYQAADEDCFMDENIDDVSSANVKNVDLNDPDFAASDLESDGGNPKKRKYGNKGIWNQFDCARLPGGVRLAKCRKCRRQVSAVAKRLERHYRRCVLGDLTSDADAGVKTNPDSDAGDPDKMEIRRKKSLSFIWKYFSKSNEYGQTIVTCNFCKKKVSNHSTRMSRHLQKCEKKEGDDKNDFEAS